MMTIKSLKKEILENKDGFHFMYRGRLSGISIIQCSGNKDGVFIFQAWNGYKMKTYDNINDAISDRFYSGKSIIDLIKGRIPKLSSKHGIQILQRDIFRLM